MNRKQMKRRAKDAKIFRDLALAHWLMNQLSAQRKLNDLEWDYAPDEEIQEARRRLVKCKEVVHRLQEQQG